MTVRRVLQAALSALALGGCAAETPFRGPGYDAKRGVIGGVGDKLVVSVTAAAVKDTPEARAVFWDYVDQVEASLPDRPGFVGYSKRRELFGNTAWTLTVWADSASLIAFIDSEPHRTAIRAASDSFDDARFARVTVDRSEVPVSWERALALLETSGRHYFE